MLPVNSNICTRFKITLDLLFGYTSTQAWNTCLNRFLSYWKICLWVSFSAVWAHAENLMVWVWWCVTHAGPTDLTAADSAATCAYITESPRKAGCHDNNIINRAQLKNVFDCFEHFWLFRKFFTRFVKRSAAVRYTYIYLYLCANYSKMIDISVQDQKFLSTDGKNTREAKFDVQSICSH